MIYLDDCRCTHECYISVYYEVVCLLDNQQISAAFHPSILLLSSERLCHIPWNTVHAHFISTCDNFVLLSSWKKKSRVSWECCICLYFLSHFRTILHIFVKFCMYFLLFNAASLFYYFSIINKTHILHLWTCQVERHSINEGSLLNVW
jgi:hypothetical protein